jgi:hypothetical protein
MKKIILLLVFLNAINSFGQITYQATYTYVAYPLKLHLSGYKLEEFDGSQIILYNTNHTVYQTITIPAFSVAINKVGYVSENLFDLDSGIEYLVYYNGGTTATNVVIIYDESGAILFQRDSCSIDPTHSYYLQGGFESRTPIYYDGVNTNMRLGHPSGFLVYTLPGTIPCVECGSNIISAIIPIELSNTSYHSLCAAPNPTTDDTKISYKLPIGNQFGEITIYNISGVEIKKFKVSSTFDFITLSTKELPEGSYLYSLTTDGNLLETKKLIVIKNYR